MRLLGGIVDFLDVRLGIRELIKNNLTGYLVPRQINVWYALGSVLLTLFAVQIVTGMLLLIYYIPHTAMAYDSVTRIMNIVPFGWLFRYLHVVGSNVIVIVLLLHMLSVLFMGSYKKPRELNWLSGFILLNLTFGLCLTGYLLPWSQLSFWATTVATDVAGAVPFAGEALVSMLRGGPMVSEATLGRFFVLHVIALPLLLAILIGFHLFCVRQVGISTPPFPPGHQESPAVAAGDIPFFPNVITKDLAVNAFVFAVFMAVTFFAPQMFIPPAAFAPADPFVTPPGIKPEWYFLWAYQTLKIFPNEFMGLAAQGAAMTFIALLPFIDRGAERRPAKRPIFVTCFVLGLLLFAAISLWGHHS